MSNNLNGYKDVRTEWLTPLSIPRSIHPKPDAVGALVLCLKTLAVELLFTRLEPFQRSTASVINGMRRVFLDVWASKWHFAPQTRLSRFTKEGPKQSSYKRRQSTCRKRWRQGRRGGGVPAALNQIGFVRSVIYTGAHQNPMTCGANQGDSKRRCDTILDSTPWTVGGTIHCRELPCGAGKIPGSA